MCYQTFISIMIQQMSFSACKLLCLATLLLTLSASSINGPVSLALTIYNNQFAMVKDTRSISFDQGRSDLYFTDVSTNIQTETVTFKALSQTKNIKVYEQNYEANLINKNSILHKFIDKSVEIHARLGQKSVKFNGTLLGFSDGYIIKTRSGIEVLNNIQGISFDSLPKGFFTLPTLSWKVFSKKPITTECEVAYRTTGFSWKSDYSITLDETQSHADVGGWVTIDNRSGKKYDNAKLKLIAGDVNTLNSFSPRPVAMAMMKGVARGTAPSFSQKSFSDYHLYTLSEPVSLNDNSQKQIEFIPKVYNLKVRKYNLISISAGGYTEKHLKASNKIEFENTKANGLGIPLPKGTVRVFKADKADNSLEFIGEDSINHTPKNEKITIATGNAFDIVAQKIASNYRSSTNAAYSADLKLTVKNHKNIDAEIVVEINNYRGDNVKFIWITNNIVVEKVSSGLLRIKRVFKANETFTYAWAQDCKA